MQSETEHLFRKTLRRVLVIGLDGASFDLIHPWIEQGLLPTFKKIIEQGASGPLTTIIPPLTGPAWISFMTGKNPEIGRASCRERV